MWLDTRDAPPGTDSTALYYSYSLDYGNTWSVNERMSPLFDPHTGYPNQDKMGDYIDIVSENAGAHVAWTGTMTSGQDVYYSFIQPAMPTAIAENMSDRILFSPNPTVGKMIVNGAAGCDVDIYTITGNQVYSHPVNANSFEIDLSSLSKGIYIMKISGEGNNIVSKLVKE